MVSPDNNHKAANDSFGKGRKLTHKFRERANGERDENIKCCWGDKPPGEMVEKHLKRWNGRKVIVHVDMDAFFAAIEQQHCPDLREKPVIIGGPPGYRGVVSTCSYEARSYGVKSAMPSSEAYRRCPHGIFLQTDGAKYTYVSIEILSIMREFSPLIEAFSIDEAFIDITGIWERYGSPELMIRRMQNEIKQRTGITASAGVAPNKIIAKMASGMDKPNGLTLIEPPMVSAFLENLPVEKVFGIGEATGKALEKLGIKTVGEIARFNQSALKNVFGVYGPLMYEIANGRADDNVIPYYQRPTEKSIGHETTLPQDTNTRDLIVATLRMLSERVGRRMRKSGLEARRVTLKLRYFDFATYTRAKTLDFHIRSDSAIFEQARMLFLDNWIGDKPVRLLGISVSKLRDITEGLQKELFDYLGEEKKIAVCEVMDKIKDVYGDRSITYSSATTRLKWS